MNLIRRIAGAARLLATGKLAQSTGVDGAEMQRRLVAWRAGGESINCLILQRGELQRARARQLVRTNPLRLECGSKLHTHAVGAGIKPSSLVEGGVLKDRIQRLWLAWTDEADADGLTDCTVSRSWPRAPCSRPASVFSGFVPGVRITASACRCSCRCCPPSTCRSASARSTRPYLPMRRIEFALA